MKQTAREVNGASSTWSQGSKQHVKSMKQAAREVKETVFKDDFVEDAVVDIVLFQTDNFNIFTNNAG